MNRRRRRRLAAFKTIVFVVLGLFFLLPIAAMVEFATRGVGIDSPRTLSAFTSITSDPELTDAITASLELAVITSVAMLALLLPTMIWARLRLPRMVRPIEMVCLTPLTIPAIVLVVGFAPIYRWIEINVSDSILMLAFAYLILVLPYSYRALDAGLAAVDVRTLSEAARSLGAGWGTVVWRVIVPNMSSAVFNACLLCVAVVLGEFTVANLLNFENLQVAIAILGTGNASVSIALAVLSLLFVFVLLFALSFLGRSRSRGRGALRVVR
ncbi:MAG: ABC transporter permease subunit [Candidatus Dormibacteria bacterium]|jgi:putative spermidine/putrescine transport system permease protein